MSLKKSSCKTISGFRPREINLRHAHLQLTETCKKEHDNK